ncbi:MAG: methyltransferase domain-containing protein [Planctomycetes bacterium]|nr:methyltransferase domain-containing protein [Planctomycetota bacterium]
MKRARHLREHMEDLDCDQRLLFNTYRQLAGINRLFSRWRRVYKSYLRPRLTGRGRVHNILDLGSGGGDIPLALFRWARADGLQIQVTAADPDPRAIAFARRRSWPPEIEFLRASARDLREQGRRFDFVISNHLLHHLAEAEFAGLLEDAEHLARELVLFADARRSAIACIFFWLITAPFFHRSYIVADGLASIRRSYTERELRALAPRGWEVRRLFPYRLLLLCRSRLPGRDALQP